MIVYSTVNEMRAALADARSRRATVGLVPTMGALHEGHLALIRAAGAENDLVVLSIFVNPTQFGPGEDLAAYPRDLDRDRQLAAEAGAQAIFAPSVEEMYPHGPGTWVEVSGPLTSVLCGRSRPTHFRGVATVVTKLFTIIQPDRAYFGQKDGQQVQVVRRLAEDLFLPLSIRVVPIVREADGLARSSRNAYLSPEERRAAPVLFRSLQEVKSLVERGDRDREALLAHLRGLIAAEPLAALDYAEIHTFPDLDEAPPRLSGRIFVGLAVRFGRARLIDNIVLDC